MNEQLAHAIFSILVDVCQADPDLRDAFVSWYVGKGACPFVFNGVLASGRYVYGAEAPVTYLDGDATRVRDAVMRHANAGITGLFRELRRLPPVERVDWVHAQNARYQISTATTAEVL